LIAQAYGAGVAPMGVTERGFTAVEMVFFEWHREEVKDLPEGFSLLAGPDLPAAGCCCRTSSL